jgi:hypothetical protein
MPKREPRSRCEQKVRKNNTQKEGRTWEDNEKEGLWEDRLMERFGCQITHLTL